MIKKRMERGRIQSVVEGNIEKVLSEILSNRYVCNIKIKFEPKPKESK